MQGGLSLKAYLALSRRGSPTAPAPAPIAHSDGPVIWAHAPDTETARALTRIAGRVRQQFPEATFVLSGAAVSGMAEDRRDLPPDTSREAAAYVAALSPEVVLWCGNALRPALLTTCRAHGARMIALNAADAPFRTPAPRWLPDPAPATLAVFDRVHAVSDPALRRLRRLGVETGRLRASGPLIDAGLPLDCPDTMHEEASGLLAGRPVWLAARVQPDEADEVLRAHRRAVRLAHRLLLVLVPAEARQADTIRAIADRAQLRLCHWDAGYLPDENTQVILAEGPAELGLWYRLAPLAFLGGSLVPGAGGHDPFEAAALGAAVLYGPNVGQHLAAYSRLVEAGAARIVRDAESLATAVSHLVAPDQAAAMAHAGWDVVSSGAALVDEIMTEIGQRLDAPGGGR